MTNGHGRKTTIDTDACAGSPTQNQTDGSSSVRTQTPHPIQQVQPPPPTRRDREIALKELELAAIRSYMGERHQNTHITPDERLILSIMYHDLAQNPWSISRNVCHALGIQFDDSEFRIDFLEAFIADYLDFGLPLDRKGRAEVKDIFASYFAGEQEQEKKQEKMIT